MIGVPFYRRDAAHHLAGEDRRDRALWRPLPFRRRRPARSMPRRPRSAREARRPLHRPVHLRRAGDRLARQQQHRRIDLQRRCSGERHPGPDLDRHERRHRRHLGHDRPLHPLPPCRRACASPMSSIPRSSTAFARSDPDCRCERPRGSRASAGRGSSRPSFPASIDHMVRMPDAASIAAMHVLSRRLGRRVGGSTGTNFFGLCWIAAHDARRRRGRFVRDADLRFRRALRHTYYPTTG